MKLSLTTATHNHGSVDLMPHDRHLSLRGAHTKTSSPPGSSTPHPPPPFGVSRLVTPSPSHRHSHSIPMGVTPCFDDTSSGGRGNRSPVAYAGQRRCSTAHVGSSPHSEMMQRGGNKAGAGAEAKKIISPANPVQMDRPYKASPLAGSTHKRAVSSSCVADSGEISLGYSQGQNKRLAHVGGSFSARLGKTKKHCSTLSGPVSPKCDAAADVTTVPIHPLRSPGAMAGGRTIFTPANRKIDRKKEWDGRRGSVAEIAATCPAPTPEMVAAADDGIASGGSTVGNTGSYGETRQVGGEVADAGGRETDRATGGDEQLVSALMEMQARGLPGSNLLVGLLHHLHTLGIQLATTSSPSSRSSGSTTTTPNGTARINTEINTHVHLGVVLAAASTTNLHSSICSTDNETIAIHCIHQAMQHCDKGDGS